MGQRPENFWARGGAYLGLAFVPPIAGWLGWEAGKWLDQRLGMSWLSVALMMLGLAAGIWDVVRIAEKLEKR
jgi:hypothetical protein